MVLKRVVVWSVARIFGTLYACIGLIVGIGFALFSSVFAGALAQEGGMPAWAGMIFGVGGVVILPIFYGVAGLIGGAIWGGLYNLFAGRVGGVELQLE